MSFSFFGERDGSPIERSTIVIADRLPLVRSCLAHILRSELPEFAVLEIETPHRLDSVTGRRVSLVTLNIENLVMTDDCVMQDLSCIRRSVPDAPVMLLTQADESTISDTTIADVAQAGVRGYTTLSTSVEVALAALRLMLAGGVYFPRSVVMNDGAVPLGASISCDDPITVPASIPMQEVMPEIPLVTDATSVAFTRREQQVLATLQRGLSNKIIANELNLSHNTVKVHIAHIMRKLRATNRTEVALAMRPSPLNGDFECSSPEILRQMVG